MWAWIAGIPWGALLIGMLLGAVWTALGMLGTFAFFGKVGARWGRRQSDLEPQPTFREIQPEATPEDVRAVDKLLEEIK